LLCLQPSIRFRTSQLEHEFGCPYQLGHHEYANRPDDAEFVTVPVFRGDVIVMGTDGLLDNISEVEILDLVRIPGLAWVVVVCTLVQQDDVSAPTGSVRLLKVPAVSHRCKLQGRAPVPGL
jgi:hypothetical protein